MKALEIEILPRYANTLVQNALTYFSGEKGTDTPERKAILLQDIKSIESKIASLKQILE